MRVRIKDITGTGSSEANDLVVLANQEAEVVNIWSANGPHIRVRINSFKANGTGLGTTEVDYTPDQVEYVSG